MPTKDVDFTGDATVSWHAVEEAQRNGAERVMLSGEQVRLLTGDLAAIAAGRKRADTSAFRVPCPGEWTIRDELASRIMIGLLASGEEIGADGYVTTAYALAEDMMDARDGWNADPGKEEA